MTGKLFDELAVGQVFQHQPGRTVTESDNVLFSCLTMNPQPLYVDFHAAATVLYAHELGLVPITTPAYSPQSNGLAEAFVKTFKRD